MRAEGEVRVGCTVVINGIKSQPELNGKEGVVTAQKEARWVVQPSGEGFAPLALKETNLTVVGGGATLSSQTVEERLAEAGWIRTSTTDTHYTFSRHKRDQFGRNLPNFVFKNA